MVRIGYNEMVACSGIGTHGFLAFNNQLVHLVEFADNCLPLMVDNSQ